MTRLRAVVFSIAGAGLGALAAAAAVLIGEWSLLPALLLGGVIWGAILAAPLVAASMGARAAGAIMNPSGRSTPRRREYSHAESLAARGLYEDAVAAYELAMVEDPLDAEPCLRIARILRDRMGEPAEAARAFKRALAVVDAPRGVRVLATREAVELYVGKLAQPGKAAPLLARMAEEHAGTAEGEWATAELGRVKAMVAEEGGDPRA